MFPVIQLGVLGEDIRHLHMGFWDDCDVKELGRWIFHNDLYWKCTNPLEIDETSGGPILVHENVGPWIW